MIERVIGELTKRYQDALSFEEKELVKETIDVICEEIEKGLLTDINGKDSKQAEKDLAGHNLSTLFSYRQAYFVGCQAQLQKILALLRK